MGQGFAGRLPAGFWAQVPLSRRVPLERYPLRRQWSGRLGAFLSLDPAEPSIQAHLLAELQQDGGLTGADLAYELSGHPAALDQAIAAVGFGGRLVIGSWYGSKPVTVQLGGHFHRSHIQIISSQVSHLAPRWPGGWTTARRLQVAWKQLTHCPPTDLITHRFPIAAAAEAYRLIDQRPDQTIQVLFSYT